MSFIEQLMHDAQPKAEAITNKTTNVINNISGSTPVKVAKNLSYKGLVNTVGIAMVIGKPVVTKVVEKFRTLAAEQKESK